MVAGDAQLELIDGEHAVRWRGNFPSRGGAEVEGRLCFTRLEAKGSREPYLALMVANILEEILHRDIAVVIQESRPAQGIQMIAAKLIAMILWERIIGFAFVRPVV